MNKAIFKTILSISKEFWRILATILAIGIVQSFVGMYAVTFFQRIIDSFPTARQISDLVPLLAAYIGLNVLNHILIYVEGIPNSIMEQGVLQWVKLRALEKISCIDYLAYQDLGTGNLVQVIENGADATRNILKNFYLEIARNVIPTTILSLIFIHYYDHTIFTVILCGYAVFFFLSYRLMSYLRHETEKMIDNQENYSKFSVRAFMELVVFRVNGRFKAELERVRGISDEIVRSRARIYLFQELFYTGFALLIFLVEAAVVIRQANLILAGASTVGTLVALVSFIKIVFWPISTLSMAWIGYQIDSVAFWRFHAFITLPDDPGLARQPQIDVTRGALVFHQVTFAYKDQEVLRDFSLEIPGGQTTAFVGASGSGKSTLIRLILHLLKPQSGQILVDGQDLSTVNLDSYYRRVAYVPQEPPIFDGTLRENLTFDRPVSADRLDETLRMAGLTELIQHLPNGLETVVGERGVKLSGGERQRLAFARVFLQDPKIVILDEPTSAMDSLTEALVTHNLTASLKGKTVILVAHRLQTVRDADRIIVLDCGTIAQYGKFEELIACDGLFKKLWMKQTQDDSEIQE
jgi:ATP-binding cassette subfamily B protein